MLGHQTVLLMTAPATALPGSSGHLPRRRKQQPQRYAEESPWKFPWAPTCGYTPVGVGMGDRSRGTGCPGTLFSNIRLLFSNISNTPPLEPGSQQMQCTWGRHTGVVISAWTPERCVYRICVCDMYIFRSTLHVWVENCRFHLVPICAFKAALNTQHELVSSFTHRLSRSVF